MSPITLALIGVNFIVVVLATVALIVLVQERIWAARGGRTAIAMTSAILLQGLVGLVRRTHWEHTELVAVLAWSLIALTFIGLFWPSRSSDSD